VRDGGRLFCDGDLDAVLRQQQAHLQARVEKEDRDYLLNVSEDDYVAHLVSEYTVEVPELEREDVYVESESEARIDVSGDPSRDFSRPGPHYLTGSRVVVAVPFEGDPQVFALRTNPWTSNPPRGDVASGRILLTFEGLSLSPEGVKNGIQSAIDNIEQSLRWASDQIARHNAALEALARSAVQARRAKVLKDRNLVESLGLPIRRREGEPSTYSAPSVRRKKIVTTPKPAATRRPFKPEPALDQGIFDQILQVITSMTHVMERSPSAFSSMGEEDLRQHFLVQLNGQFQGAATGETFNYEGKTDLLIREQDRNVFIGECKIWKGPATLTKTLDQILGYLAWRDTKAAILMFVRTKNFTAVLDQVSAIVEGHPSHKKTLRQPGETEFRFVFGQRDDSNREITLAVLMFAVPSAGADQEADDPPLS
jgi:hypothetical protein